jgi:hypothetical protein
MTSTMVEVYLHEHKTPVKKIMFPFINEVVFLQKIKKNPLTLLNKLCKHTFLSTTAAIGIASKALFISSQTISPSSDPNF